MPRVSYKKTFKYDDVATLYFFLYVKVIEIHGR